MKLNHEIELRHTYLCIVCVVHLLCILNVKMYMQIQGCNVLIIVNMICKDHTYILRTNMVTLTMRPENCEQLLKDFRILTNYQKSDIINIQVILVTAAAYYEINKLLTMRILKTVDIHYDCYH